MWEIRGQRYRKGCRPTIVDFIRNKLHYLDYEESVTVLCQRCTPLFRSGNASFGV